MNRKLRLSLVAGAVLAVAGTILLTVTHHAAAEQPVANATPRAALTVSTVSPALQTWPQRLELAGNLAAWQTASISSDQSGLRITQVLVDVGTVVKRGQLLAQLDSSSLLADLHTQEATVAQDRAKLEQAHSENERSRAVKDSGALSAQKIVEYEIAEKTAKATLDAALATLEAQRIKLEHTRIVAVDDGMISARSANLGMVVSAGTELFQMVRQSRVEWRAEVSGQQLDRLKPGLKAKVTLPDGSQVNGTLRMVGPTLDSSTRNALAYVDLPVGNAARPGMFVRGAIDTGSAPALTLPSSAIVLRDGHSYVFEVDSNGQVRQRQVDTGRRQGDQVELTRGVNNSVRIVASGGAFLNDGDTVRVVNAGKEAS